MTATLEDLAAALADRYRVERELGEGGMATVYLAEDVRHRRKVAITVQHPELFAGRTPSFMPAPLPGDSEFLAFGGGGGDAGRLGPGRGADRLAGGADAVVRREPQEALTLP